MPKEHKTQQQDQSTKSMASETFGPSLSEAVAQSPQQRKNKLSMNSNGKRATKWKPFPVDIKTTPYNTENDSSNRNNQKPGRNRRRRKNKAAGVLRCRKPSSPSVVSTCSSSSGIGSMGGSSALTNLNGTHDAISTPTLPSSGCSSIGCSDDKYEDNRFSDLISERDSSEIAADESGAETLNDDLAVSVGFATENYIKSDLTHPIVQQFYQEQRIIYREFYERQFSTIACIPYSDADTTYCALSSQFNHCNVQSNNKSRLPKHSSTMSNKNNQKSDYKKGRTNRQTSDLKPRVFYNSSTRLDSHQKSDRKESNSKSTSTTHDEKVEETQNNVPSCSENVEEKDHSLNESQLNTKENSHKREDQSNYSHKSSNSYNKKRYDSRTSYRSNNHEQHKHDKDKKTDIDLKTFISCMDPLSAQIYNFQKSTEQTTTSLCEKLYLRDLLYCNIAPHFIGCGLYIVGSTLNGFGSSASDMDLCLMITSLELDQRSDAIHVLNTVKGHLASLPLVEEMELIYAKVPILRATFHAPFDKITIDLNANNAVAIRNTHLLCFYAGFDWRVRPLVCAIKEWAKKRGINNANQSSLTSYSLVLMAIHYLQSGVKPAILPSLQHCYQDRFSGQLDVRELDISYPLSKIRGWEYGKNTASLSELLTGFFRYYARDFDFDESAISVRLGKVVERRFVVRQQRQVHHPHYNSLSQWRCICIEEPFTLSNAAHSVFDERMFAAIKESFNLAYTKLEKNADLDNLLNTDPISIQTVGNDLMPSLSCSSPSTNLD